MSSLLRTNSLVRRILCRNSIYAKTRSSLANELKNGLHTRVIYNKQCVLDKKFDGFNVRTRYIQQAVPAVSEPSNRRRQPFRSQSIPNGNDLDKAMFKLDLDVRRTGRLSKDDVEKILQQIKLLGKATSMQGLLIVRCCGSLLAEENVSSRTELANRLWKTLEDIACPLDVSHYNALLKVYIDNEQPFSPIEFLAKMDQNGIVPNRVTYQRLIGGYCQKGDLDGASKILEFMKEKEIAVNEFVFNELIFGHAKINDIKGAKDMLEVMKNAKLEPSSDSYFQLARGVALHGNMEELNKTIEQAERDDIFLTDKDVLAIVSTLAVNGHADKAGDVLKRAKKNTGYNQECVNVILDLINRGQDETAFEILKTMPRNTLRDGSLGAAGHFLIKQMVRAGRPAELVLSYCKEMEESQLNDEGLLKAAETAITFGKPDHALLFFKEMSAKGFEIRNHYFWPVLIQKAKEGEQAIYDVLKAMCDLVCIPNYDTYMDYALPHLNTLDPKAVVSKLKEFGQTAGAIVNPLMAFYLLQSETTKAADLLDEYPVRLDPALMMRTLALSFKNLQDVAPIIKILEHLKDNPEVSSDKASRGDWCSQFLIEYARSRSFNVTNLKAMLDAMEEKNLQIAFAANKSQAEVISLLQNVGSSKNKILPDQNDLIRNSSHPNEMNVEELENHLLELRSKSMNVRGVLRRLLLLHCRFRNVDRAIEIKEELDNDNFYYSPAMHSQLMDLFVYSNKLDEALRMKSLIEQDDPNFALDDFKILNLAALMVKEDRVDDAIQMIVNHYDKFGSLKRNDDFLTRNVFRLLSSAADKGDIELTNKLFDLVVVRYQYSKPNNIVLGTKIKACLKKNDVPAALKEFEFCASNYKCTPWRNELFKILIQAEDTDNLQKIVDLSNNIHGEATVLYELACAFIDLDHVKQAKKILETPGLRANNYQLDRICDNLIEREKIKELEQFVSVTRDLFDVDRDKMYYNLLRGYAKQNNVQKALGVWTSMQEEDVQPSPRTLVFLAEFLKKNNQPVPFEVPELPAKVYSTIGDHLKNEDVQNPGQNKINLVSQKIRLFLQQDNRREAIRLTEDLLLQGLKPNAGVLKFLMINLSEKGEVEFLQKLGGQFSETDLRKLSFDNMLCNAYINSGQYEVLIERLEKDKTFWERFPKGGFLSFMDKCPEVEPRLLKIAERMYEEDKLVTPKNMIWQHYLMKGNYEKADQIMKSCPEMNSSLLFLAVIRRIQREKSVPLAQKLVSVICDSQNFPNAKGLAYGSLIEVLVKNDQVNEALETFNEAIEKHSLSVSNISHQGLVSLDQALREKGQNVPFEIPDVRQRQQQQLQQSSSSSDSDSSDDEKIEKPK